MKQWHLDRNNKTIICVKDKEPVIMRNFRYIVTYKEVKDGDPYHLVRFNTEYYRMYFKDEKQP